MKLGLVFGSVVLLMAGITLVGNSSEVMGQAEEVKNTNTNSNTTEGAWAVSNKSTFDTSLDTDRKLLNMPTGLQKYDNARYGISFMYPPEWGKVSDDCPRYKDKVCGPGFGIMSKNTSAPDVPPDATTSEIVERIIREIDLHSMRVLVYELDKPSEGAKACNCSTMKDFLVWDYNKMDPQSVTFINDNQTTIGKNYSAWQTEKMFDAAGIEMKKIEVYAINGDRGYKFHYLAHPGPTFDLYLEDFKNMLKTVTFTSPIPEKKPSFLNSSDISNLSASPTQQAESVRILSSNDFTDSIGYLHVVGEIENNTPANINFVKVTGTFYDSNNQVVATDFTYTNPSDMGPAQKAPFELLLTSASIPISQIDHYNLQATYD